jgi:hypothetical protein
VLTPGKKEYYWKTPAVLSLFFALLCLPGLTAPIHGDEAVSYLEHIVSSPFHLLFNYSTPNQHTLFTILSNSLMRIFGEHEFIFRFPVFMASIFSIFVIYYLGQSFWNKKVATIASLLIIGSYHHLNWAQNGRGYALSELLALTCVLGITLLLDKKPNKGALVLVFSGFALCLTLPSNAYFLPGCSIATLVVMWRLKKTEGSIFWFLLEKKLLPFIFLMILTVGYFFTIFDDLVRGIETYKNFLNGIQSDETTEVTLLSFYKIIRDLARPWGLWLYILVLYGIWTLNKIQRSFFLILLGTPTLVVVLTGILGPPRAYIYIFPFLILLAALGIERGTRFLFHYKSHYFTKILIASLCLVFLIPSVLNYFQSYQATAKIKYATMDESRKAHSYLKNKISKNELLIIPIDDMALRRTLAPLIAEQMLHVFKDGWLDKIIFIGHQDAQASYIHPHNAIYPAALTDSFLKVIANIGKVRINKMNVKITPLLPLKADMNFSQRWGKFSPKIYETETREHSFLGKESWQINKKTQEDELIGSPFVNNISLKDKSFILYGYAEKYRQESRAGLLLKGGQPVFSLNQAFGVYQEKKSGLVWERVHPFFSFLKRKPMKHFKWHIMFMLFPLNAGINQIREALFLREDVSYFDGFQSYLLTPLSVAE